MMTSVLKTFWQEEDGQDMVEYALLLAFVALGCVTVLGTVKGQMQNLWSAVSTQLSKVSSTTSAGS